MKIKPISRTGGVVMQLSRRDDNLLDKSLKQAEAQGWPFRLKNILVPIDFSATSHQVLRTVLPIARKFGARICLMYVVEPRVYPENIVMPFETEDINARMMRDGRSMLDELRRRAIAPTVTSDVVVAIGKPYQEIVATAKKKNADLIVISTHGHTGLKHALIGSTAERVVRHAGCPVLVVRQRK